ncbi:CBS domain-containing protein [Halorarum salinum]|uniref:CBS domain-containing protein n=1 Tax=Halorarum salinum TaxID=2743089 RepID=A0A7D5QCI6_9EURY|nr:CBS domain-containing protein [Halobaculum salinum]QLG64216.1 CBS domain-containing protein [Halobaculum salinum]
MDISDARSHEFESIEPETTLSKVRGAFTTNERARVAVVEDDGEFAGVVTRKQLLASRHSPDAKARTVMQDPPRVDRTEDVRETARLMVESGLDLLPVFEGSRLQGVVTAHDLLAHVQSYLDALSVEDVATRDLITATPDTTLGEVINSIREYGISRLPVVDDDDPVGLVSVYDLVEFTVREMQRQQGGSLDGFDEHGGRGTRDDYNATGGHGERAGFAARMLDLPVSNLMSTPARTVEADVLLDDAVERMLADDVSSLVVVDGDGRPTGIVTKTDVLRSLTWTEERRMPVRVFGVDLMDVLTREEIADRVEAIEGKYDGMSVIEAHVAFQKHRESNRGMPLVRATVRLFTDRGTHAGTGEEYGTEAAFDAACDVLERNVLDEKEKNRVDRKPEDVRERNASLLEWWLEP